MLPKPGVFNLSDAFRTPKCDHLNAMDICVCKLLFGKYLVYFTSLRFLFTIVSYC